jgi:hypothetical protein
MDRLSTVVHDLFDPTANVQRIGYGAIQLMGPQQGKHMSFDDMQAVGTPGSSYSERQDTTMSPPPA